MKPIIRVENLSKQYRIGEQQPQYSTLRESLVNALRTPHKAFRRFGSNEKNSFWALHDVSFEVMPGEVLGIIGRNGAGKSTLLKILSRITEPTTGRIELYGRIGSLLEVGTGFHSELTGRENIFLNGSILGMRRAEIAGKFDEIVEFSEIEKFIDTPVKHYSSGMYMRLAFAVAAHLEPEILIVDEVLSVGDSKFQNKCLGKMEEIGKQGRTVLFVSHNMAVVRQLCRTAILLEKGCIEVSGATEIVLKHYFKNNEPFRFATAVNKNGIEPLSLQLIDSQSGEVTLSPIFNRDYQLNFQMRAHRPLSDTVIYFYLYDELGILVSCVSSYEEGVEPFLLDGFISISFPLPKLQLFPSSYSLSLIVSRFNDRNYFESDRCLSFEVQPAVVYDAALAYNKADGIVRISDGCRLTFGNDSAVSLDRAERDSA